MQSTVFLNALPSTYFVTKGYGDTDELNGNPEWGSTAQERAMEMASIARQSLIPFNGVFPGTAQEVPLAAAQKYLPHGALIPAIVASAQGYRGDILTAGIGRAWVYDKEEGHCIGAYASQYGGNATPDIAQKILLADLRQLLVRRHDPKKHDYVFKLNGPLISHQVENSFGVVMAALCWLSFEYPQLDETLASAISSTALLIPKTSQY